jgi:hypothetical protein
MGARDTRKEKGRGVSPRERKLTLAVAKQTGNKHITAVTTLERKDDCGTVSCQKMKVRQSSSLSTDG